jgi:hypothetical protein
MEMMIDRHLTEVELRRLGNGWLADVCPMPKTADEAKEVLEIVHDGIRALQSTDELGHPVITTAACDLMLKLQKKADRIEKIIKKARVVKR